MSDITALARMAASTEFGLLDNTHINSVGLSRYEVQALIAAKRLHRVRRGYLALAPPSWRQRLAATVASVKGAAVSHRSAARLLGLWSGEDIDVTVRYPRKAQASGATVHRSRDLVEADLISICGFRVTSAARTLCDLGLVLPPTEVQRLVDHAIATDVVAAVDLMQFRWRVSEHGRTGVSAVDTALEGMPQLATTAESGPELRLLRTIELSSLPGPTPQFWVAAGGSRYRIDLAYPELKIGIEFDGEETHSSAKDLASDRRRQRALEAEGWIILRYRWSDLTVSPSRVITEIETAIRLRQDL